MTPSQPLPIPDFLHTTLRRDSTLISKALTSGLLHPLQLDPTCSAHVTGLLCAARENPTLPLPPAMLTAMSTYHLWEASSHPAIATHLAARLHEHGLDFIVGRSSLTLRHTLPRDVEAALLDLASHGRLTADQLSDLRTLPALSTAGRAAFLAIIRSRASKKAAATRKHRQLQGAATPTPRPTTITPLLAAIRSGDPTRLRYFTVPKLKPANVRAVLSEWLAAPAPVTAFLIQFPGLPPDAKLLALEAWVDSRHQANPVDPVETSLLARLSLPALDTVLTRWLHGLLRLEPAPDEATLHTPLFRLALDRPERAAWIRNGVRLTRWRAELDALISAPPPPPVPNDPEARWVRFLADNFFRAHTQALGLALMEAFHAWPAPRQHALARPLRTIVTHAITVDS